MKKMKLFLVAASLTLVTAGVFAGKSKFVDSYQIYGTANGGTTYVPMQDGAITLSLSDEFTLGAIGSTPAAVSQTGKSTYSLYYYDATTSTVKNPIALR